MHSHCLEIIVYVHVICAIFQHTINNEQRQCFETTIKVNDELEKRFFSLGCDGWLKVGLPTILVLNLHVSKPFLSIWVFLKVFIINTRHLDHPKLGPWLLSRCEHFGPIIIFF
jgi:hypothetical protein